MSRLRYLAPVAAFAATACFASKADVVLLQDEMRTLRAMQARADSARQAQSDSLMVLFARNNDSLRAFSQRFGSFQANVGGELFEMGKQLITIQELAGMSSRRIMELRSTMEERGQTLAPADTVVAPPGPAQLFQSAYTQLTRGSYGTARQGFEELLRQYPDFDQASMALLYIGQSYAQEQRIAEADSVYSLVVVRYPRSPDAATALYKYGISQLSQGRTAAGRAALQRVVKDFPESTEAELATDRLRTIR
ncbi:MAG: tetratricopeptide repeat protein [Gemmatimonadaceae bacterium]